MAKDPAFLFYPNDWQGGTQTFSRHIKGCYIDLLTAQFNSGPLSLEEIKTVLGADFGSSWPTLQKKFKASPEGLFFNDRLELEKQKRAAFSESRRNNIKKRYERSTLVHTHEQHMYIHMENENENRNTIEIEKGVQGEKQKTVIGPQTYPIAPFTYLQQNHMQYFEKRIVGKKINLQEFEQSFNAAADLKMFTNEQHFQNFISSHIKQLVTNDFKPTYFQNSRRSPAAIGTGNIKDFTTDGSGLNF